ncbi:hypothetical protein QFZ82_000594 [Streptomyces sp. V4I23]|nr:hypothetical protein [Streptomyces sp. V4I23]
MALQKYDMPLMGRPGSFEERWWSAVNTPVLGPGVPSLVGPSGAEQW